MDTKKILSRIALIGGEAIIIAAFILFKGGLSDNILILNIVVSSLIYGLFFIDTLIPWLDVRDKSQKKVGSLGLRWFFTWFYTIGAIAIMLAANLFLEWSFSLQFIIHCALLFLLIMGFVASFSSSDKVKEVHLQESFARSGILEMKTAMQELKNKINNTADFPDSFSHRIHSLYDGLRYISPSNNQEAYTLENSFLKITNDISFAVSNFKMNELDIEKNLTKLEQIYQNRKSVYSN